jgi:hypothetical protein
MKLVVARNPGQPEFHQAVAEVVTSVMPFLKAQPKYIAGFVKVADSMLDQGVV